MQGQRKRDARWSILCAHTHSLSLQNDIRTMRDDTGGGIGGKPGANHPWIKKTTINTQIKRIFRKNLISLTICGNHKREVLGRTNRLLSLIRHRGHIENDASNNSIIACVFVTAVTFLPSRCLATTGRFLPSRCVGPIGGGYTQTATWSHKPIIFFKIAK
jgi:hypothetical protein